MLLLFCQNSTISSLALHCLFFCFLLIKARSSQHRGLVDKDVSFHFSSSFSYDDDDDAGGGGDENDYNDINEGENDNCNDDNDDDKMMRKEAGQMVTVVLS